MNQIDGAVPDRWVRVFLAAGEETSFTAAARLLGVGQSAVSHAVSRLEDALDTTLFLRSRTGVELTAAGEELARGCRAGFSLIDAAMWQARSTPSEAVLTVSVSTSLATYWLMPRLAGFKQRHPDIDLRCITNDTDSAVGRDGADLWIPLGRGDWLGYESIDLCVEELYPVAAPELVDRMGLRSKGADVKPRDLLGLPTLHLEERYASRFGWSDWFSHDGIATAPRIPGVISNDYSLILQAALDAQGVALGWHHIVKDLVGEGRLVRLSERSVLTGEPFVILSRPGMESGSDVDRLRQWLIEEMAA